MHEFDTLIYDCAKRSAVIFHRFCQHTNHVVLQIFIFIKQIVLQKNILAENNSFKKVKVNFKNITYIIIQIINKPNIHLRINMKDM